MGLPSRIGPSGPVVLVGGGIGVAPLYPIARGFHEVRTQTTAIIGFQTGAEIFWRDKFRRISHPVIVVTEDGGCGRRGTVVDALRQFLELEPEDDPRSLYKRSRPLRTHCLDLDPPS